MPRVNVTDDETILHDTERRRRCAPFTVPNLNGAAGRATCCRSSGSQGACARSMCAVLCRTWLPKSKAELVGRGFDIGVASSSSSLPPSLNSVGRSVRGTGDDERSIHHAVRSSPSLLCQTSCSLARWDRPFTHSSSSRVSPSLRPCDACSATRPSSLHSILCHAVTTYNKGQSKERASPLV